jgi:hypothetical protein
MYCENRSTKHVVGLGRLELGAGLTVDAQCQFGVKGAVDNGFTWSETSQVPSHSLREGWIPSGWDKVQCLCTVAAKSQERSTVLRTVKHSTLGTR